MLAKGVVLSWLNRVQESDELLVSTRDLGWVDMLPDLMYYYWYFYYDECVLYESYI